MEKKGKVYRIFLVVLVALILLLVILLLNFYAEKINGQVERQAVAYLEEVAAEQAALFDDEIDGALGTLVLLADFVAEDEATDLPEEVVEDSPFTWLGVIPLTGKPAEGGHNFSGEAYFERAKLGEDAVVGVQSFPLTETGGLALSVPIRKNGAITGVLAGFFDEQEIESVQAFSLLGSEGYSYIVDAGGNVVLSHGDADATLENVTIPDMEQTLVRSYVMDGQQRYIGYAPSAQDGWYVLTAMPGDVVASQLGEMNVLVRQLSTGIIVAFLACMVYIVIVQVVSSRALRMTQEDVQLNEERYKTVVEQANDIVFEWNLVDGSMYYSNKWEDVFGVIADGESQGLAAFEPHVHEDYKEAYVNYIEGLVDGKPVQEVELKMINKDGSPIWCKIHSTALHEHGVLCSVIGTIRDITKEHVEKKKLIMKTLTDSLTGLYTKEASKKLVDGYIRIAPETDISAFMIIDIDNFKAVNDTMGHPYGDKILRKVAKGIKGAFRKSDIYTRIGGDEFSVFVKNIPDRTFAVKKADEILEFFHGLSVSEKGKVPIYCSIGISFMPGDGDTFDTLYKTADVALYTAKERGKNRYSIYTGTPEKSGWDGWIE